MVLVKKNVIELLQGVSLDLEPTQDKLSFPMIERIYKKMSIGILLPEIQVHENLIIDGHHRYIASILSGYSLGRTSGLKSLAKNPREWRSVTVVDIEWEGLGDIKMHNERDARYNDLSVEELIDMIS